MFSDHIFSIIASSSFWTPLEWQKIKKVRVYLIESIYWLLNKWIGISSRLFNSRLYSMIVSDNVNYYEICWKKVGSIHGYFQILLDTNTYNSNYQSSIPENTSPPSAKVFFWDTTQMQLKIAVMLTFSWYFHPSRHLLVQSQQLKY